MGAFEGTLWLEMFSMSTQLQTLFLCHILADSIQTPFINWCLLSDLPAVGPAAAVVFPEHLSGDEPCESSIGKTFILVKELALVCSWEFW